MQLMTGLLLLSTLVFGQNARVQIIHNSPTATVDVYANGTKLLNDFAYRTATPFMDLPAGVTINLGIGLASSQSVRDTSVNIPVVLEAGKRYVIATTGTLGHAQTPLKLAINNMGLETASSPTNVGIGFFHGAFNLPDVDLLTDTSALFDNIQFGKFGSYINFPANTNHRLALSSGTNNYTLLARFETNLSFWAGKTAVIFTSGLLGSTNPNEKFETWVALSNGGTFPLKNIPLPPLSRTVRLQVINNSPTATIDIYLNGDKLIDNLAYRAATSFISVPANTLNLGIAPATSTSARDVTASYPIPLDSGRTYIAITHGIIGSTQKPFGIATTDPEAGREISTNPNNVDVNFFNGSLDIPAIDILTGNNLLFDSIRYARFGNYKSLPANATYRLSVTPGDNNNILIGQYDLNLSNAKGKSAFIIATGFLNNSSTPFQPWVVLSDGVTFPLNPISSPLEEDNLPQYTRQTLSDFVVYPNPAKEFVIFNFNLENEANTHFQIINTSGQIVEDRRMGKLEKGQQQLTLDTKTFNTGMYIVRMTTDNEVKTKKLMIKR